MTKLIIISNTSWNLFNFRLPLMLQLRDEGYEVIAAAPLDEYSDRIKTAGFHYIDLPINNKGTNPIEDIGLMVRLYHLFKSEKPDIILTYTPKPNIYASLVTGLMSIPIIPNISGLGYVFIKQSFITRIVKFLYRLALRFPPCVFFQNYDDLHLFVDLGLVRKDQTKRIPGSGINTQTYRPNSDVPKMKEGLAFLLIARMLWDKGVQEFVEAARITKQKFPNTEFKLLGFLDVINPQAISREQMQQWVNEGTIEYMGTSDNVRSHILSADCVVLPSYREGLPRTLLEGACLAKPLIASEVPGCRDVINDGVTGFLCRLKDASDLAICMQKMIALTDEQRAKMGMLGRQKIINEFDEKHVIDIYLQTIKSALNPIKTQ